MKRYLTIPLMIVLGLIFVLFAGNVDPARPTQAGQLDQTDVGESSPNRSPANGPPNEIHGYSDNSVLAGVYGATISGGGDSAYEHEITDHFGVIGGGEYNRAGNSDATLTNSQYATVGGGTTNTASGDSATIGGGIFNWATGIHAVVGGGTSNTAGGASATVAGGEDNTANGDKSTIGGGQNNTTSQRFAVVPGGYLNNAGGYASFAAGARAKANHDGAFVWADYNTGTDFASTAANQFLVRASGGVSFSLNGASFLVDGSPLWSAANDGSGSGLDADTIDGLDSAAFAMPQSCSVGRVPKWNGANWYCGRI